MDESDYEDIRAFTEKTVSAACRCAHCGVKDICKLDDDQRLRCKLEFGYHPINYLALEQLQDMRRTDKNWVKFLRQMDKRDIVYWNEMALAGNRSGDV